MFDWLGHRVDVPLTLVELIGLAVHADVTPEKSHFDPFLNHCSCAATSPLSASSIYLLLICGLFSFFILPLKCISSFLPFLSLLATPVWFSDIWAH